MQSHPCYSLLLATSALFALSLWALPASSLRSGAPSLACTTLTPFHGFHRAKPASASPFHVIQSSDHYGPNSNITVTLTGGKPFRGFMIQAYDPATNGRIGHFVPTALSKPINSCSATTHRNNDNKQSVELVWVPQAGEQHVHQTRPLFNIGFGPRITAHETTSELLPGLRHHELHISGGNQQKRVKFRGSIVVSFDDFYTGFESSWRDAAENDGDRKASSDEEQLLQHTMKQDKKKPRPSPTGVGIGQSTLVNQRQEQQQQQQQQQLQQQQQQLQQQQLQQQQQQQQQLLLQRQTDSVMSASQLDDVAPSQGGVANRVQPVEAPASAFAPETSAAAP